MPIVIEVNSVVKGKYHDQFIELMDGEVSLICSRIHYLIAIKNK